MADNTSKRTSSAGGKGTKKTSATKSSAKKAPTKKASTKKASGSKRTTAPRAEPSRRPTGSKVAEQAARQLAELTGKEVEGVTALSRSEEGWRVELEVLELRRIPTTTDVLATYEVVTDASGELEEYRRLGRYVRGQTEDGS
jgi:hypothetical protein